MPEMGAFRAPIESRFLSLLHSLRSTMSRMPIEVFNELRKLPGNNVREGQRTHGLGVC